MNKTLAKFFTSLFLMCLGCFSSTTALSAVVLNPAPSAQSHILSESGTGSVIMINLDSAPTANVTVSFVSNDTTEGVVEPSSVVFTPANWGGYRFVSLNGVDDVIVDGVVNYTISISSSSTDPAYNGYSATVNALTNDDDCVCVVVEGGGLLNGLITTEAGGIDIFTMNLSVDPVTPFSLTLRSSDEGEGSVSPTVLNFDSANYLTPQTVTLTGMSDGIHDGNQVYYIYTSGATNPGGPYDGKNVTNFSVINVDDDISYAQTKIEGTQRSGLLGRAVSNAGDVNGDGWDDFILGAPGESSAGYKQGRVHLYYGSATGISGTPDLTLESDSDNSFFGGAIAAAGDVNNDGYADVLVGAYKYSGAFSKSGKAFLYYGSASGLVTVPAWTAEASVADERFGLAVSSAGDVNNDGYADILVGAPGYRPFGPILSEFGRAYLYLGSATGPSLSADWMGEGENRRASYGDSVAGAGDVNGDGFDDFMVAASKDDQVGTDSGRVYLYHGTTQAAVSGLLPSWVGYANSTDYFGSSIDGVGDVNGDGYDDILIGAYLDTTFNFGPLWDSGKLFVFHGSATGLAPFNIGALNHGADWAFPENTSDEFSQARAKLGVAVSRVGDINGDGYADIIAGASLYSHDETNEGWAFIFYGAASGLSEYPNTLEINQDGALFGIAVSGAGDVDKDGVDDFIVGADLFDTATMTDAGAAFLYLSSTPGILVSPTSGLQTSESLTSASFSVTLATAPTADVDISIISNNPAEGSVNTALLRFTPSNWFQSQIVTVTGVDDGSVDGDVDYTILIGAASSADSTYNNWDAPDVSVTNIDNDVPEVSLTVVDSAAWETGPDTALFSIDRVGSTAAALTVNYSLAGSASNGSDYQTLTGSVTILAGSSSAQLSIIPIDDVTQEGSESVIVMLSANAAYAIGAPGSGTVFIDDNDSPAVRITPKDGLFTTEAGGMASFDVVLLTAPTANVTIGLSSNDLSEGKLFVSELLFTPSNWSTPQSVVVVGQDDVGLDNDVSYAIITLAASSSDTDYSGMIVDNVAVVNIDDDPMQNISLVSTQVDVREPRMGTTYNGSFVVTRVGDTASLLSVDYSVSGSATSGIDYAPLSGNVILAAGNNSAVIDITPYPDAANEGDETLTLTLLPSAAYVIDQPSADTVIIVDDDQPDFPVVNFNVDQVVGESNTFEVWAILDRPATAWVFVPYTVSGTATNPADHLVSDGTIAIPAGLDRNKKSFNVVGDAISDDGETIIFTMGGMSNAAIGVQNTHTVTIREINIAPVVSLRARQPVDSTRTIVTSLTNPWVDALVEDANINDTFTYDWTLTDNALVDVFGTTTDGTFVFLSSAVSPGFYNMHVKVTDNGVPPLSTEAELLLDVVNSVPTLSAIDSDGDGVDDDVESYNDADQDGIADYLDNSALQKNQLQQIATQSDSYIMVTDPGLQLRLGDVAFAAGADGAQVSQADITNYGDNLGGSGLGSEDSVPNVGGYFDFEIAGLAQPGDSASIVIPQLAAIPQGAGYRKYSPLSGWRDFVVNANNTVASAVGEPGLCPIPNDPAYSVGLTPGHYCMRLTIEDGGPNDNDGVANAVVEDPGKISVVNQASVNDGSEDAENAGNGGGALGFFALIVLFLLSRVQWHWQIGALRIARRI